MDLINSQREKGFSKTVADRVGFDINGISFPAVFVIKKNTSILENLYSWIKEAYAESRGRKGYLISLYYSSMMRPIMHP